MVNILNKIKTHREAMARAMVRVSSDNTIQAINEGDVPKGNVFEMAKAAGLLAIKNTHNAIPGCHPLPIEHACITYKIVELDIFIEVEVHTIYKTGVEVEAMHGASIAALTMYDMLKQLDEHVSIGEITLVRKRGGECSFIEELHGIEAAVIVCSDAIAKGTKHDKAGQSIVEKLEESDVTIRDYIVIPDEHEIIRERVKYYCSQQLQLVIITGGTGLTARDVTPESIRPILEREIPGIGEAIRAYGQERTPYSMLSRSVAGMIGDTLVLAMPGSTRGAIESMEAIFPYVLHIFRLAKGAGHGVK
jgi:molybdenum cofactor biosynthesis protein MoaC